MFKAFVSVFSEPINALVAFVILTILVPHFTEQYMSVLARVWP